ncbi:MAG: hypothetical protein MUC88_00145 [Planctomycetes bacterium]|jgi:hypothetical protein|nr:hypothetical protein [Planctomycetota bacterium]
MTKEQAQNVVAILQKVPLYYRNFGIWWWHVKSELKRNGFGPDQLFHLGPFTDPSATPYYAGISPAELDRRAYSFQYAHAFSKYNSNMTSSPDGELYLIHDQDVE